MRTLLQKRRAYLATGGIGVLLSAGYLALSIDLPFGQLDRPGAAVFPVIVGVVLMLASLVTLREGLAMDAGEKVELPAGVDRKRLLGLVGLLFGYMVLLPWLGQILASVPFCVLLMRLLSDLSWIRTTIYSLLVSGAVYTVFVVLLDVPMPRGILLD